MRFDILERLLEVDRRASQVSLLHEEKARRAAANAASIPSRSMSGTLASSSPVAGSRTSRVLRAPTLFPSIRFVKMPRTPAAARALSRSADTESAETDCSTMSVFPSNKSQDSANSRQWLEVAIEVGEELGKQIADVPCEVREASGVVGQPGMHLAELIDQDRHSEDDRVKRSWPVGPEKIPIFAQNFGDGREVL